MGAGAELWDYFRDLLAIVQGVLQLNPEVFIRAFSYPGAMPELTLAVVFIAGLSVMLGQCVVLIANRVSRTRFWASILLGVIRYVLDVLIMSTLFWLIANLVSCQHFPFLQTVRVICLAYAPYWLGFLVLMPYLGLLVDRLLKLYFFLTLLVAAQAILQVGFWTGVLISSSAFSVLALVDLLVGRPLTHLVDHAVFRVSGAHDQRRAQEIYAEFASQITEP